MPNALTVLTWATIISQSMVSSAFGLVKGPSAGNPQKVEEGRLLLGRRGICGRESCWGERVKSRSNVFDSNSVAHLKYDFVR